MYSALSPCYRVDFLLRCSEAPGASFFAAFGCEAVPVVLMLTLPFPDVIFTPP